MVRVFQAGDRRAFDDLVRKYKDRIFNLCYRFLGDYQDANDTAQDVFIKVFKSIKGFRFESKFSTWLYRVAVNTCKNKLSSRAYKNRNKTESMDAADRHNPYSRSTSATVGLDSAVRSLEKKERMVQIQKAIDALPVAKKTVVLLRDVEGLSYEEIVRATGFNLGTVKSKIARARRDLRKMLGGAV